MSTLPEGNWTIDPVHSSVSFRVPHLKIATFRGGFEEITGGLENGVLSGEVPVSSINVGKVEMFTNHMLSADWFDAGNHPTIAFKSTSIETDGENLKIVGDFTLRGVTKQVTGTAVSRGPVAVPKHDGSEMVKIGVDITAVIDRTEFGLDGDGGAGHEVTFDIGLELVQA